MQLLFLICVWYAHMTVTPQTGAGCVWLLLLGQVRTTQGCYSSDVGGLLLWLLFLEWGWATHSAVVPHTGMGCSHCCCSSDGGRMLL